MIINQQLAVKYLSAHGAMDLYETTSITGVAADILARFHKGDLHLHDLIELSETDAASLAMALGDISLTGLTELSDPAAAALAKHRNADIWLNGLTEMSGTYGYRFWMAEMDPRPNRSGHSGGGSNI